MDGRTDGRMDGYSDDFKQFQIQNKKKKNENKTKQKNQISDSRWQFQSWEISVLIEEELRLYKASRKISVLLWSWKLGKLWVDALDHLEKKKIHYL